MNKPKKTRLDFQEAQTFIGRTAVLHGTPASPGNKSKSRQPSDILTARVKVEAYRSAYGRIEFLVTNGLKSQWVSPSTLSWEDTLAKPQPNQVK